MDPAPIRRTCYVTISVARRFVGWIPDLAENTVVFVPFDVLFSDSTRVHFRLPRPTLWLESTKRTKLFHAKSIDRGYDADVMTFGPEVGQF
jgi:hypothetical protein